MSRDHRDIFLFFLCQFAPRMENVNDNYSQNPCRNREDMLRIFVIQKAYIPIDRIKIDRDKNDKKD